MGSNKKTGDNLTSKLNNVIEKSNAQKKMLKKILSQLNKQSEEIEKKATIKKKL